MSHHDNPVPLGNFEFGIVRRKVRQIITRAGFTPNDKEDLIQELLARLLHSLPSFDPAKGHRKAFVTTVVERDVASLLRDRSAQKRDSRRVISLNATISDAENESVELFATIEDRQLSAHLGIHHRSAEERSQLANDLQEILAVLPKQLQELALQLRTKTKSEVSREFGVPRTTINSRVRQIRQRLEKAGLRHYL